MARKLHRWDGTNKCNVCGLYRIVIESVGHGWGWKPQKPSYHYYVYDIKNKTRSLPECIEQKSNLPVRV